MPLVSRTRATLRSAEFGFFGVCGVHPGAHAAPLGRALQRRRLGLGRLRLPALADQLLDGGHTKPLKRTSGIVGAAHRRLRPAVNGTGSACARQTGPGGPATAGGSSVNAAHRPTSPTTPMRTALPVLGDGEAAVDVGRHRASDGAVAARWRCSATVGHEALDRAGGRDRARSRRASSPIDLSRAGRPRWPRRARRSERAIADLDPATASTGAGRPGARADAGPCRHPGAAGRPRPGSGRSTPCPPRPPRARASCRTGRRAATRRPAADAAASSRSGDDEHPRRRRPRRARPTHGRDRLPRPAPVQVQRRSCSSGPSWPPTSQSARSCQTGVRAMVSVRTLLRASARSDAPPNAVREAARLVAAPAPAGRPAPARVPQPVAWRRRRPATSRRLPPPLAFVAAALAFDRHPQRTGRRRPQVAELTRVPGRGSALAVEPSAVEGAMPPPVLLSRNEPTDDARVAGRADVPWLDVSRRRGARSSPDARHTAAAVRHA